MAGTCDDTDAGALAPRLYFERKGALPFGMTSTISSKGQITVPRAVRARLGLRPGTRVAFELTAEGALLRKDHAEHLRAVDRVRGILKREAPTDRLIKDMRGPAPSLSRKRR